MRQPADTLLSQINKGHGPEGSMVHRLSVLARQAGVRGLFDGISGTWLRQMTYSICRFWAYDESKKLLGAGASSHMRGTFWIG